MQTQVAEEFQVDVRIIREVLLYLSWLKKTRFVLVCNNRRSKTQHLAEVEAEAEAALTVSDYRQQVVVVVVPTQSHLVSSRTQSAVNGSSSTTTTISVDSSAMQCKDIFHESAVFARKGAEPHLTAY
eukprot:gene4573-6770_t